MSLQRDRFKQNVPEKSNPLHLILGLGDFKRNIEKNFFAEVLISPSSEEGKNNNLIVEINSNFTFEEVLFYLKNYKDVLADHMDSDNYPFLNAFKELQLLNKQTIDVEEVYITLKDTCIIVQRIYEQSIPEQLENILLAITHHDIYFTKGMSEIPYEIYIPVFEQVNLGENEAVESTADLMICKNTKNDYFGFWGLYFDSEENAVIYDLKHRSLIHADLFTYH